MIEATNVTTLVIGISAMFVALFAFANVMLVFQTKADRPRLDKLEKRVGDLEAATKAHHEQTAQEGGVPRNPVPSSR